MGWIILLIIGFILWAAIGHVFWLVLSYPFTQISSRNCSECGNKLRESDKACRSCGWTSVPIGIARSLRISRQTLEEALKRGLIDQTTLDRGLKVLTQLEERIESERRPGGTVARQVPSITPESKPSVPEDSPLKTIPHVLNDLPAKMPKETMSPKVPSKPTESIEKSQRVILPQATVSAPPERHALDK